MIKAVIFDLDGVLLDNTPIIIKIFQEDAKMAGIKIPDKKSIVNTIGFTWTEMVEKLLGKDQKYKKIHREVWKRYEDKMALMAGAKETLRRLKKEKAIVTSKPRTTAIRQLKDKDILGHFKFIIAAEDTKKHKPNPDPLLRACGKLNVKPKEVIYIGDFIRDFEMARNAGVDFIGILSGAASKAEFKRAGALKLIRSLPELLDLIE